MRALPWIAAGVLAVIATVALVPAVGALVGADPRGGGVDLQTRLFEIELLWGGVSPFSDGRTATVYPPATYVVLGPLGLFPYAVTKWLWAISGLALLAWLGSALARRGPDGWAPVAFVLPFAISGVAYGFQNGQLHVHTTAAVAVGLLLLVQRHGSWGTDLTGAALVLVGLVKPTLAAPFVALLLVLPGRRRPLVLVVAGYLALTGIGLLLAGDGLRPLAFWLSDARYATQFGAPGSYGNVHAWTEWLGLERGNTVVSLAILGGVVLGALAGTADDDADRLWIRLGLLAVVARVFAYHQDYDDALLILTLGGLLTRGRQGSRLALGLVVAITLAHLPDRSWLRLDQTGPSVLAATRTALWLVAAGVLWHGQRSASYPPPGMEGDVGGSGP